MRYFLKIFNIILFLLTLGSCKEDDPVAVVNEVLIKTTPATTIYNDGDLLDLSGLQITLNYSNGTSEDVAFQNFDTEGIICEPEHGSALVAYVDEVTITYLKTGVDTKQSLIVKGKVEDNEGNIYSTVKIGDQVWMAENIKAWHDNDGNEIPFSAAGEWPTVLNSIVCGNNSPYGNVYSYSAAQNICPTGWRLPSVDDWGTLQTFALNSELYDPTCAALRSSIDDWFKIGFGTDDFGFSARPGGYFARFWGHVSHMEIAIWWTSTEEGSDGIAYWILYDSFIQPRISEKASGLSVRCIRD